MVDMKTFQEILSEAERQLKLQRQYQQETGDAFNIFTVLDRERKEESTHCRLLYELLNPKGSHGCGDAFLQRFFQDVLGEEKTFEEEIAVHREESIDDGRIDLVLEGRSYYYPIEVKIDAGDQERQAERYLSFAKKKRPKVKLFYLTLDGHEPSPNSIGNLSKEQINCISFEYDIRRWIENCEKIAKEKPNISIILRQYRKLLNKLTSRWEEDCFMKELVKIIGASQSSYESAIAISNALIEAKVEKGKAVCYSIIEHIRNSYPAYFSSSDAVAVFNLGIEAWYRSKRCTWPAVYIPIGDSSLTELCLEVGKYGGKDHLTIKYGVRGILADGVMSPEKLLECFPTEEWKAMVRGLRVEKIHARWLWSKEIVVNGKTFYLDDGELFERSGEIISWIIMEIDRQIAHIQKTGLPVD